MKIAVTAPRGKMGALIVQGASERANLQIEGVLGRRGSDYIGKDAGFVCGLGREINVMISDDWLNAAGNADVIIDFSTVEVGMEGLAFAVQHRIPFLCGTTGFTEEQRLKFREASKTIPVMPAANTSKVVHLMARILKQAAEELKTVADIEIIEMHDRYKLDAPSGTSKELGAVLAEATDQKWEEAAVFGRKGSGIRKPGEIGYHSLRSGDISSSHSVLFGLMGERLEITHHAHNWRCFAEGALDCGVFLKDQKPGLYSVQDVFK